MTITHLSPTRIRAIQYHDLRDAVVFREGEHTPRISAMDAPR